MPEAQIKLSHREGTVTQGGDYNHTGKGQSHREGTTVTQSRRRQSLRHTQAKVTALVVTSDKGEEDSIGHSTHIFAAL